MKKKEIIRKYNNKKYKRLKLLKTIKHNGIIKLAPRANLYSAYTCGYDKNGNPYSLELVNVHSACFYYEEHTRVVSSGRSLKFDNSLFAINLIEYTDHLTLNSFRVAQVASEKINLNTKIARFRHDARGHQYASCLGRQAQHTRQFKYYNIVDEIYDYSKYLINMFFSTYINSPRMYLGPEPIKTIDDIIFKIRPINSKFYLCDNSRYLS